MSAHYNQFDTVVNNGLLVDKERVDKLKEHWTDLQQQVDEKKMFVTAGLELQQVHNLYYYIGKRNYVPLVL